ncbi:uncharacterized protein LY89DRAFT_665819 [Mollisia scopiformis]|uniref:Uncharacterized protein n=1 Tax=Mollisia scopiformis TaxID=149040 RepID=A0A194XMR6_MOLSC|nr:uncharacterized protein LY89DRAFT_665819 [Mollisia scopiformis]KUJ21384.1 hypothetical protein LY89DRAFT_665819 [Mollisia scopiformis]
MSPYASQMATILSKAEDMGRNGVDIVEIHTKYLARYHDITDQPARDWLSELSTWTSLFPGESFQGVCPHEQLDPETARIALQSLQVILDDRDRTIEDYIKQVDIWQEEENELKKLGEASKKVIDTSARSDTMIPLLDQLLGEVQSMKLGDDFMDKDRLNGFEDTLGEIK